MTIEITYVRSSRTSVTTSVLLEIGTPKATTRAAIANCIATAHSHTTGPQPRSASRADSPRSARRLPVPHRRLAYTHHHREGP